MLWIHDKRRSFAPNIVNRPPFIYPEDNNGGFLPLPYFTFGGLGPPSPSPGSAASACPPDYLKYGLPEDFFLVF